MASKLATTWVVLITALVAVEGQQISGYGPVDVAELNPLTLSWNQVHFLVRENLLAIDELRDEHDKIYQEIHECFGLERCRKQENFMSPRPPSHGDNLRAGALLESLRKTRLGLEGQQSVLEAGIRETQRIFEATQNRGQHQRGHSGGSSSSSSGSSYRQTFSSSSSYSSSNSQSSMGGRPTTSGGHSMEYDDYEDGPVPNRG